MYDPIRLSAELDLLRSEFPDIETRDADGRTWVRVPRYPVPPGWSADTVELVFAFPTEVGQPPYAFLVRPALNLPNGTQPGNYTTVGPATPWGHGFAQFSWSPLDAWIPRTDLRTGPNMLTFARSFATRLAETS